MLLQLNPDQVINTEDISSISVVDSGQRPVAGAAFDFKPDTVVTFKNGETMRVTGRTPEDLMTLINVNQRVPRADGPSDYNYAGAVEDVIKLLDGIKEHVHTLSEMVTRQVLSVPGPR